MSHTFPKSARLLKRGDFKRVLRKGKKNEVLLFTVHLLDRKDHGQSRLGITVTKKYGNAVQRNRAKRIIREAFRLEERVLPKGMDIHIRPHKGCLGKSMREVAAEFQGLV